MADFSVEQRQLVETAYANAQDQIERLERANDSRESGLRQELIDDLSAQQAQINDLQFFTSRSDYSPEELDVILSAAGELLSLIAYIEDTNNLTLTSLGIDLATFLQRVSQEHYEWAVQLAWLGLRRPDKLPDDVRDSFCLYHFELLQGRLNGVATRTRDAAVEGCLNEDDYSGDWLDNAAREAALASGQLAVDDYVRLERLKAAERLAVQEQQEASQGVAGYIWDVIGWDSPWDFVKDVAITAAFNGAGAVRWFRRIKKAKDGISKAKKVTQRVTKIRKAVETAEKRLETIRDTAKKIRRAKALSEIPGKVTAAFKELEKQEERLKKLELIRKQLPADYFRTVASGAAANIAVDRRSIAGQAAEEAARKAILNYMSGTSFGEAIERRKDIATVKALVTRGLSPTGLRLLSEYVLLVWVQEVIVRITISNLLHKRPLSQQAVVAHLIAASGVATEKVLVDIGIIPDDVVKFFTKGVLSFMRKLAAEVLQEIARAIIP